MATRDSTVIDKELYELSTLQATELLNEYLAKGEEVFRSLKIEGLAFDYSQESVIASSTTSYTRRLTEVTL